MAVNAVYFALLLGNILLIVASLFLGPRLLRACRAAAFVNAIAPLNDYLRPDHPETTQGDVQFH